jgi:hypothetical protein
VSEQELIKADQATAMTAVTPMQLLSMAVAQGADIDKLEKLMALQERWEANNARKEFDNAIAAAKSEIKPIVKRREVDFTSTKGRTNYMYEDMPLVAEEIDPILSKHGLSYRYRSSQEGNKVSVTCIIAHRAGHSELTTLSAANDESGNKNSIQAIGSAATYLQRYTLKLALGLSATKDTDGNTPSKPINDAQLSELRDLLAAMEKSEAAYCKYLKIKSLEYLPEKNFETVKAELTAWHKVFQEKNK